jgi:zinc transporter, ZIP family
LYPFIRRLSLPKYTFFPQPPSRACGVTWLRHLLEANRISFENVASSFNCQVMIKTAAIGLRTGVIQSSLATALMVAIGIGLHNLSEGLAIGAAMVAGEALHFLIVRFISQHYRRAGNSGADGKRKSKNFVACSA